MKPKIRSNLSAVCLLLSAFFFFPQLTQAQLFSVGETKSYGASTAPATTIIIDQSGWYFIEAWGGNGGRSSSSETNGSRGISQPVRGYFYFNIGDVLNIQAGTAGGDHRASRQGGLRGEGTWFGHGFRGGNGGTSQWTGGSDASGGGGGGAASGVLRNGTSTSHIILASGGGGGRGGGANPGAGGGGGNSNAGGYTVTSGSTSSNGSGTFWGGTTDGFATHVRHDGVSYSGAGFNTGGGGGGGGGGGWDGGTGGGGQSGSGGDNNNPCGGGGAGGRSDGANTETVLPLHLRGLTSSNNRTSGDQGQVYITFVGDEYQVYFDDNGGTGGAQAQYTPTYPLVLCAHIGDANPQLPVNVMAPVKPGFTFMGYFLLNDADPGNPDDPVWGSQYYNNSSPTSTRILDWNFWQTPPHVANKYVTLAAKWSTNYYTVTYTDLGKSSGAQPTDATLYTYGALVTVGGPHSLLRDFCDFGGWTDGTNTWLDGETFSITDNVTLNPVWVCAITYVPDNGTTETLVDPGSPYPVGANLTILWAGSLTPPTNHVFTGWKDQYGASYQGGQTISITRNLTLTAQWTPCYSVLYIADGLEDSGIPPTDPYSPYAYGATVKVRGAYTLDRAGYTLIGWEDQDFTFYLIGSTFDIEKDMTLSPVWEPILATPLVPYFKILDNEYYVGETLPLTIIDGWENELIKFSVNGTELIFAPLPPATTPMFTPITTGVYLIEARNTAGNLKIWKYVNVIN